MRSYYSRGRILATGHKVESSIRDFADESWVMDELVPIASGVEARLPIQVVEPGVLVNKHGTTYNEPQDHGFMYGHGFQDLDGHIWELIYMEPSSINQG